MHKAFLALATSATLAGCASTAPTAQVAQTDDGVVCRQETALGSQIMRTRCTTAEERQREREAAEAMADKVRRKDSPRSSQSGG